MAEQATTQPTTVILINKEPRVRVYIKTVETTVQGFTKTSHEHMTLRPGANRLPRALVEDKSIREQMKADADDGRVVPMAVPLSKMKDAAALELIELTGDVEMLNEWLAVETRDAVKQALRKQITGITGIAS